MVFAVKFCHVLESVISVFGVEIGINIGGGEPGLTMVFDSIWM